MTADQTAAAGSGAGHADPSAAAARALMHRIDLLEHANQRLKRQGIWMLVILAVVLGLSTALVVTAARHGMPGFVPDVVEGREFLLRDGSGRVRGAWGSDDQGAIRFVLQDARNQTSIKLNLLQDGSSGLTFSDSAGTARLVLAVLPDQTVNLVMGDGRGVARTVLGLNPNGGSTLVFADAGGSTRTGVGVDSRGRPMLSVGPESSPADEEPADSTPAPARNPPRRR